jgi:hypothetical protein
MKRMQDRKSEAPRVQPYLLAFADERFEQVEFPAIRQESENTGVATTAPEDFLELRSVAPLLREVLAEGSAVEQFGPLLFQAYHFWRYDKQVFALTEPLTRSLLGSIPSIGHWEIVPPAPAGYVQLPRNLLWARIEEGSPAEAIDGWFWTMVGANDPAVPPFPRLDVVLVLGLMSGRPGFSIASLELQLDDDPQGHWGDAQMRERGDDFANILPGGELQRLHGMEAEGEVFKLLSRCFWYISQHPESIESVDTAALRERQVKHSDG